MRKFNEQTGCYKIDLFINGVYVCSTDQSKTTKEAKKKYEAKYGKTYGLTAEFYQQ